MIQKVKEWVENKKAQFKFVHFLDIVVRIHDGSMFGTGYTIILKHKRWTIESFDGDCIHVGLSKRKIGGKIIFCYAQINDLIL